MFGVLDYKEIKKIFDASPANNQDAINKSVREAFVRLNAEAIKAAGNGKRSVSEIVDTELLPQMQSTLSQCESDGFQVRVVETKSRSVIEISW